MPRPMSTDALHHPIGFEFFQHDFYVSNRYFIRKWTGSYELDRKRLTRRRFASIRNAHADET